MFLPIDHKYEENIMDFFIGRFEMGVASSILLGKEFYDVVLYYKVIVFDFQFSKQKFYDFGVTFN